MPNRRHNSGQRSAGGFEIRRIAQFGLLAGAATLFGLGVCAGATRPQDDEPSGRVPDLNRGKALYAAKGCYECHGYVGQGALWTAPRLVPQRLSGQAFSAYVRHPSNSMPAYPSNLLSDADIGEIYSYLASLPRARPPAKIKVLASFTPDMDEGSSQTSPRRDRQKDKRPTPVAASSLFLARGTSLYQQRCSACHGTKLEGGVGPRLMPSSRAPAEIAAIIMAPPPAMPRLYPNPLTRADVEAISAYVSNQGGHR